MKAFLNYSGKGGVGKTTTTYCLYKAMKALGKETMVLDMDLNTPSMHHLIKNDDLVSNHEFKGLFLDKSVINLFIRRAIKAINGRKPDVLLIDTPPSITDIHFSLIQKFNISAVVLVSQPTELSKSDVERTVPFFEEKGITVVGIVENMVENNGLEYRYEKLIEIPKSKGLDSDVVFKDNKENLIELSQKLLDADLLSVSQENKKRVLFDESIGWDEVKQLYHIDYDEHDGEYSFFAGRNSKRSHRDIKFVNLNTWKQLHEAYCQLDTEGFAFAGINVGTGSGRTDCIHEATYERVERLVEAFRDDDKALFMIANNPHTNVPTMVGEIGIGTLKIDDKFQGIPTIEYQTNQGVVRMFPHEVIPVTDRIMSDAVADGYIYIEEGKRFIPPFEVLLQYAGAFGSRVGAPESYEGCVKKWEEVAQQKLTEEQLNN